MVSAGAAGGKRGDGDWGVASVLVIKDPGLGVATNWAIRITL